MEVEYKYKVFRKKKAWKAFSKAHNWEVKISLLEVKDTLQNFNCVIQKDWDSCELKLILDPKLRRHFRKNTSDKVA